MAYTAVVSLVQILKPLLHSDQFPVKPLYDKVSSLQSSLESIYPVPKQSKDSVNKLEIDIRDAVYEAQDIIESRQILSPESEEIAADLQEIISKIGRIAETAKGVADSIGHSTDQDPQKGDLLSEEALSTKSTYSGKSSRIVGQEEDLKQIKLQLLGGKEQLQVVPISGLPGSGKTTLAKSVYDDPDIEQKRAFQVRSWVTVSQESRVGDILAKLLSSMETVGQKRDTSDSMRKVGERASQESDAQLGVNLHQRLFNIKYLIVIDDMWDVKDWDKVRNYLPDNKNGSRILLTTRIAKVADHAKSSDFHHVMRPLSPEDSWILLCDKAFEDGSCPPHLEEVGKEIAKHCDGLPLSITVVGGLLSQKRRMVEDWRSVEQDIYAALVAVADVEKRYLEILSLSYNHLPGRLKGCFLYMGAFPEDSEILVSKLIKLWVAEGFLTPPSSNSLEQVARHSLNELIDRNLILIRKVTSDSQIKTCGVHDSLRALAVEESRNQMFFFTRNRYVQDLPEGSDRLRRLSVHKNVLMCLENVYNSTKSIKSARTILYAGPHHHHPFPFSLTFDLLRVLDALTLYFIEFPNEVVTLLHLRYLSFTYNGKIPPLISKLRKLQVLIVRQYPKIIFLGASVLPVEIWNMPELRHLLFTESNLPDLSGLGIDANNSVLLGNLQSLSDVHASCCTEEVLGNIPNLRKLGTWVEEPSAVHLCLDQLTNLEAFKFIVLNPIPKPEKDLLPKLVFPETLTKLTLSGCGLHWEDMTIIEELPNLEVLKLREFAFQGPIWDLEEMVFPELKFLLLESLELQQWLASDSNFPSLERLIIRHCYELEEIPPEIADIGPLQLIQLVDCSPSAVAWAQEIKEKKKHIKKDLEVRIHSSWA